MKYFQWKIKKEHHILKEFEDFLEEVAKLQKVQKIIPGRIARQQKATSAKIVSFSYFTNSWLKFKIKKWATAQEIFIVCKNEDKEEVLNQIKKMIK